MEWIKRYFPVVLFVVSIAAVIFDRQVYAVVSLVTALALWFPSMIDRISLFRVWSLEVRLNQKISEAEKMQRLQVRLLADWIEVTGNTYANPVTIPHRLEYVDMVKNLDGLSSNEKKEFCNRMVKSLEIWRNSNQWAGHELEEAINKLKTEVDGF